MAPTPSPSKQVSRGSTLLITNLTKLAGVALGLHSGFTDQRPTTLAFAGLLVAGGQFSETVLLHLIDRLFGER